MCSSRRANFAARLRELEQRCASDSGAEHVVRHHQRQQSKIESLFFARGNASRALTQGRARPMCEDSQSQFFPPASCEPVANASIEEEAFIQFSLTPLPQGRHERDGDNGTSVRDSEEDGQNGARAETQTTSSPADYAGEGMRNVCSYPITRVAPRNTCTANLEAAPSGNFSADRTIAIPLQLRKGLSYCLQRLLTMKSQAEKLRECGGPNTGSKGAETLREVYISLAQAAISFAVAGDINHEQRSGDREGQSSARPGTESTTMGSGSICSTERAGDHRAAPRLSSRCRSELQKLFATMVGVSPAGWCPRMQGL
jgi:hypothetical protein